MDDRVTFWRQGQIVKSLKHSDACYNIDMDKDRRLLAVATKDGVSLWKLDTFTKIDEQKIGIISNVRFNANATKLIASQFEGPVFEISLR